MIKLLSNMVIQLEDRPVSFRCARKVHLECSAGIVWLTIQGQAGDFILTQGEQLLIESDGRVLVQGLPAGTIRLSRKAPVWFFVWNGLTGDQPDYPLRVN